MANFFDVLKMNWISETYREHASFSGMVVYFIDQIYVHSRILFRFLEEQMNSEYLPREHDLEAHRE